MTCFYCKGSLQPSTAAHVVTLENCIIIVKNVPCLRCDQCGEVFYDDAVTEQLERIVKMLQSVVTEIAVVNYEEKVA